MAEIYESSLNILKINNKDNDQNNNKGVSVEIIKLPNEAAGVNIHNKAAIRPAFNPKANWVIAHKIIEIKKWIIGENSLTAHSSFPNIFVDNAITHAINGGFVK